MFRTTVGLLLAVAFAQAAAVDSPPPVPIGKIDARAIWTEPRGVDTSRCDNPDNVLRRQLDCVLNLMRHAHASPEALAFTRWYASVKQDIGYVTKIRVYGPVSLATVALPLRRNTNAHTDSAFEILNGTPNPVHGDTGCSDNDAQLLASRDFQRLEKQHPNISTWEGTGFANATTLPGGVQRFVFSCPLGDYHAAAGSWFAFFALDFDRRGKFLGHRVLRISPGGQ